MSSYIGRTVAGKYTIVRKVGSGGMGSVYAAEKVTTHELFALKFMNREFLADRTYIERFKREIASLNAIRHPNVVNVFDWNLSSPDSDESPYIVMELLEGQGLDELLASKTRMSPHDAITVMLQVLDGLAAAHELGVIHRDLGTSNVFLVKHPDGKFHVKLLDFGLAKPLEAGEHHGNITREGTVIGKAAFAAPEIFHGLDLDERSDIFACGMMMMRMLTGKLPYREASSHLLWVERYSDRDNHGDYSSPRSFNPDIPSALDAAIMKAVKKNPAERYANAREFQARLLRVEKVFMGRDEKTEELSSAELQVTAAELRQREARRRSNLPPPAQPVGSDATSAISSFDVIHEEPRGRGRLMVIGAALLTLVILTGAGLALLLSGVLGQDGEKDGAREGRGADLSGETSGAPVPGPVEAQEAVVPQAGEKAETVHLVVLGTPGDAVVEIDGTVLTGNPPQGRVVKGKEALELKVTAKGYEPHSQTLVPSKDLVINLTLRKSAVKPKTKGSKKKDKVIKGRIGTTIKTDYEE
jgi:serine/threonine protein kinase